MDGLTGLLAGMVMAARLRGGMVKEADRSQDRQGYIEQRERDGNRGKEPDGLQASHGTGSVRALTKATASGLSQALGPTARPTSFPSRPIKTVVGRPRTRKALETSLSSSSRTGNPIPK